MVASVCVDVGYCFLEGGDGFYSKDVVEEFGGKVLRAGGLEERC